MKKLLSFCLLLLSIFSFAQINFEKAYFIKNNDERVECLIKNVEWKYNPKSFVYKLGSDSEEKTATIKDVKEFEIYDQSHYIRANVKIDASNEDITQLSHEEKPEFVEEQLFLRQLTNGTAKLYKYSGAVYNTKYFYQIENGDIQQLIYKMYYYSKDASDATSSSFLYNETYKTQLRNDLKCSAIQANETNKLFYKQNELVKFFNQYNECADPNYVQKSETKKSKSVNVNVRPRINYSSLAINDYYTSNTSIQYFDMENKISLGFGVELELILPINRNKWAIIIEPTYQKYTSENVTDIPFYVDKRTTTVEYTTIELPIGIRHYMFLNNNSKLFINAQFVLGFNTDSTIKIERKDYASSNIYDIKPAPHFAFGAGYNVNNKYAAEFRYFINKSITKDNPMIKTNYSNISFILSYQLF